MLSAPDWDAFISLLAAAQRGRLDAEGELRLRWLMSQLSRSAQFLPLEEVVDYGVMFVGLKDVEDSLAKA